MSQIQIFICFLYGKRLKCLMELFYLACAFVLIMTVAYYVFLPKFIMYARDNITEIKQQLEVLEHALVNIRQQLHRTESKYQELTHEMLNKQESIPDLLHEHELELKTSHDKQVELFHDQLHTEQIEAMKQQHMQQIKDLIKEAVQNKMTEKLGHEHIQPEQILNKIIVTHKKTHQ